MNTRLNRSAPNTLARQILPAFLRPKRPLDQRWWIRGEKVRCCEAIRLTARVVWPDG